MTAGVAAGRILIFGFSGATAGAAAGVGFVISSIVGGAACFSARTVVVDGVAMLAAAAGLTVIVGATGGFTVTLGCGTSRGAGGGGAAGFATGALTGWGIGTDEGCETEGVETVWEGRLTTGALTTGVAWTGF